MESDSYKELLRHFCAQALFCTFGKLGKLRFFWCYCDPRYVTFKLTLEGFKIIIASFWIKNKLLCTTFESDFQRSFYVNSLSIWASIPVNQAMPDYGGRLRVVWLVRALTCTLRGSIDLRIWTSFSFRRSRRNSNWFEKKLKRQKGRRVKRKSSFENQFLFTEVNSDWFRKKL